jgi:hypothetical protein
VSAESRKLIGLLVIIVIGYVRSVIRPCESGDRETAAGGTRVSVDRPYGGQWA